MPLSPVSLIGYGEVGRILAEDLRAVGVAVSAFDVKLQGEAGEPMREHALRHGVRLAGSHADADHPRQPNTDEENKWLSERLMACYND